MALWRICPTTVSLLLKSEPIEINRKFKFLVEGVDIRKNLKHLKLLAVPKSKMISKFVFFVFQNFLSKARANGCLIGLTVMR